MKTLVAYVVMSFVCISIFAQEEGGTSIEFRSSSPVPLYILQSTALTETLFGSTRDSSRIFQVTNTIFLAPSIDQYVLLGHAPATIDLSPGMHRMQLYAGAHAYDFEVEARGKKQVWEISPYNPGLDAFSEIVSFTGLLVFDLTVTPAISEWVRGSFGAVSIVNLSSIGTVGIGIILFNFVGPSARLVSEEK